MKALSSGQRRSRTIGLRMTTEETQVLQGVATNVKAALWELGKVLDRRVTPSDVLRLALEGLYWAVENGVMVGYIEKHGERVWLESW